MEWLGREHPLQTIRILPSWTSLMLKANCLRRLALIQRIKTKLQLMKALRMPISWEPRNKNMLKSQRALLIGKRK